MEGRPIESVGIMDHEAPNCFYGIIEGRVQGVGYRVFARDSANRLRITGWVKNLPNGNVEILAEGDELVLTDFLTDLYRGPVLSHVRDIKLEWRHVGTRGSAFEILR